MTYELPGYDAYKLAYPDHYDDEPEGSDENWTAEDYAADAAEREMDSR